MSFELSDACQKLGCPIAAGECQRANECYLWRCEHPNAPKPESAATIRGDGRTGNAADEALSPAAVSDDDLLAAFAELLKKVIAARGAA
mgnify:CR=1 FL=1